MRRTSGGVAELWAQDDLGLAAALGWAHCRDRMTQMMLVRLIGQGRICECLADTDDNLTIDVFMREMGFAHYARAEAETLDEPTRRWAEAYCAGVNAYLQRNRRRFELWLVGYRPEPWTVTDILMTILLMGYIGLGQSQQDAEKLIIQAIRGGVDLPRLRALFSPHLDGLDETTVDALRRLKRVQPFIPDAVRFAPGVPKMMASNSWVVGPGRSASGVPIHCCDPHLETNRLPPFWYEHVMRAADESWVGVNMPGIPGQAYGRNRRVSAGFTYGFMDQIDYFIEECRGEAFRRGDDFVPFDVRRESVKRKKHEPVELTVYENLHGTLEADPRAGRLDDGLYLCRAWSGRAAATTLSALRRAQRCTTVDEAARAVRDIAISANWTLADVDGNIGYQQSGRAPARTHSGLHPVLGWEAANDWDGFIPADQLAAEQNPEAGFIASANNDVDPPEGPLTINLCQGTYRYDRMSEMIRASDALSVADMQAMQADLHSPQAALMMPLIRPHLPDGPAGDALRDWDLRFDTNSTAAPIFSAILMRARGAVFGPVFGEAVWRHVQDESGILPDFFPNFDRILLDPPDAWLTVTARDEVFARIVPEVCEAWPPVPPPYGLARRVMMRNIFFDGKLPAWLGFDHGPIELPGSSATLVQGALFNAHGRQTTFFPSWRYIADLSETHVLTVLAGGPSDRRTSSLYRADIRRWLGFEYKRLDLD